MKTFQFEGIRLTKVFGTVTAADETEALRKINYDEWYDIHDEEPVGDIVEVKVVEE